MKFFTIALFCTISVSAFAELSPKTPNFTGAQYCQSEEKLEQLPVELSINTPAQRIVVSKRQKKLFLLSEDHKIIKSYNVAFGFGFETGAKAFKGDGRTPEGVYEISKKTKETAYHRSLLVSYPNAEDSAFARKFGKSAGGSILIHGFPSYATAGVTPEYVKQVHPLKDWTLGCMAVTNDEIEEIYSLVAEKTIIEICSQ